MRKKMSAANRAKQFMPFAALKGYEEALRQKEKIVVPKVELSEDMQEILNRKLGQIRKNDRITVSYYHNGEYIEKTGMVSGIDREAKILWIVKTRILMTDIRDLRGERFGE